MENATKALLIAAAVLVAIIIISLTLVIVRQGQEAVNGADLSEAEAAQFNSKFTSYEGTSKSTSQVNALLNTVFSHNQQEKASGEGRYVAINVANASSVTITSLANNGNATQVPTITGSKYYTVTCVYTGNIVTTINVKANS